MKPTSFVFDADSTLIASESFQDMVKMALRSEPDVQKRQALEDELVAITNAGMNGDIDFDESLRRRMTLAPVTREIVTKVTETMLREITEGMPQFIADLHSAGHTAWIVSGGILTTMVPLGEKIGIPRDRIFCNEALWEGDVLKGLEQSSLRSNDGKAILIRSLTEKQILPRPLIMIGDGIGDLHVFLDGAADTFFGFGGHAVRPKVEKEAPHFFRSVREMRTFVGL